MKRETESSTLPLKSPVVHPLGCKFLNGTMNCVTVALQNLTKTILLQ